MDMRGGGGNGRKWYLPPFPFFLPALFLDHGYEPRESSMLTLVRAMDHMHNAQWSAHVHVSYACRKKVGRLTHSVSK